MFMMPFLILEQKCLDGFCVYLVILPVCAYKFNQDDAVRVVDMDDQSVLIACDIKANPVIGQNTGIPVVGFHIRWLFPVGGFDSLVPGFQGLLGILSALFGPMFPQRPFRNNSHATSFPVWEHTITLFPYREQAKNRATLDGQTQVTLIGSVAFFDFCKLAVFIKRNYPVRANA
jgi:hypothetical protein